MLRHVIPMGHGDEQSRAVVGHQNVARLAIGKHAGDRDLERIAVDAGVRRPQPEHQVAPCWPSVKFRSSGLGGIRHNPRRTVLVRVVGGTLNEQGERVRLAQPLRQT